MISRSEDARMADNRSKLLKLVSICLSYPDDELLCSLDEIERCLSGMGQPAIRAFQAFILSLRGQPKLSVQEHYTSTFDLNPSTSLNFTYHLIGDGEERGRILADLQGTYCRAGFEPAANELPDYLPLVLEFLSEAPEGPRPPALSRLGVAVATVAKRLEEAGSIYAGMLSLVAGLVPAEEPAVSAPEGDGASRTTHQKTTGLERKDEHS
jgi:nitrate reductase delta subunit